MAKAVELAQEETLFFSTSREHHITYKPETHYPDGKIKDGPRLIKFQDFTFKTRDLGEIECVRDTQSFRRGKIKEVTQEELIRLKRARMPRAHEMTNTSGVSEIINQIVDNS